MTFIRITIEAPDKLFDFEAFERSLIAGQDKLTQEIAEDFELTASTFEQEAHKPRVTVEPTRKEGDTYRSAAVATGYIYYLLNWGSPAHAIRAKYAPRLSFRHGSGFISKTDPGVIMPSQGANTGEWVSKVSVSHPGHKPRRFDLSIAAKHKDDLLPVGLAAIDAGLKAAK